MQPKRFIRDYTLLYAFIRFYTLLYPFIRFFYAFYFTRYLAKTLKKVSRFIFSSHFNKMGFYNSDT